MEIHEAHTHTHTHTHTHAHTYTYTHTHRLNVTIVGDDPLTVTWTCTAGAMEGQVLIGTGVFTDNATSFIGNWTLTVNNSFSEHTKSFAIALASTFGEEYVGA